MDKYTRNTFSTQTRRAADSARHDYRRKSVIPGWDGKTINKPCVTYHAGQKMDAREVTLDAISKTIAHGDKMYDKDGNLKFVRRIGGHSRHFVIVDHHSAQKRMVTTFYRGLLDNGM